MATNKLKVGMISSLVIASALTTLVIEHKSQVRIQQVSLALQQQADQLVHFQTEHQRLSTLATQAIRPPADIQDELQRLRAQVTLLRRQTNTLAVLREKDRQLQVSVKQVQQERRNTKVQPTVQSEEAKARIRYCMQMALAAMEYAAEHQDQFPTDLSQVATFLSAETKSQTNFLMAEFEIVCQGTRSALGKYGHPGSILLIRERQPWRNTDGQWVKAYAFSDGSGQIISLPDGNFEAWERQHIILPEPSKP